MSRGPQTPDKALASRRQIALLRDKQWLTVPCPACESAAGEQCTTSTGLPTDVSHTWRRLAALGLPIPDPAATCSEDGCDGMVRAKGRCGRHYMAAKRQGLL